METRSNSVKEAARGRLLLLLMFAAQEKDDNRDDSGKQQRREQDHGRRTGRRRCTVLRPRGGCCRGRLRCCRCGRLRGYGCGGLRCGFGCDFGLFRCRNLGRFCRGFGCIGLRRAGVVRLRRHSICIAARADIVHKIVSERGNRLVQHGAAAAACVSASQTVRSIRSAARTPVHGSSTRSKVPPKPPEAL